MVGVPRLGVLLAVSIVVGLCFGSSSPLYDLPNENKFEWEILERSSPGRYFGFYNEYLQNKKKPQTPPTYEVPLPGVTTNKNYLCVIPYSQDETEVQLAEQEKAAPSVEDYLLPLDTSACIYRWEGWWSYELCFGKYVRQFHQEKDGPVTAEFFLGKADENSDHGIAGETGYSETYPLGTTCDLTKAPRSTRVIYRCSTAVSVATFSELREPSTCTYDLFVDSPSLCSHPKYKPAKDKQALKVNCFETPLPDKKELDAAVEELDLKAQNALRSKTSSSRKVQTNDAEKNLFLTAFQSRLFSVGLNAKILGADFIDHLYSLFGSIRHFDWVTRPNILIMQNEYRRKRLDDRLDALNFPVTLTDDEINEVFSKLSEGKNSFDWLTIKKLDSIIEMVEEKKTKALAILIKKVMTASELVLEEKGLDSDRLTKEDLSFIVSMVESSKISTSDLELNPTFVNLIDIVLALTPADIQRRRTALELTMKEYGQDINSLPLSKIEDTLRIGKVAFDMVLEDDKHRFVFVDLDKVNVSDAPVSERNIPLKDEKKSRKVDEDIDEL